MTIWYKRGRLKNVFLSWSVTAVCSASQLDAEVEARVVEMALSSTGSFSLTLALWGVTFCLVNLGWRVKVGWCFHSHASLPVKRMMLPMSSRRAATMKWMGCPVIREQRVERADACLHLSLPAFLE